MSDSSQHCPDCQNEGAVVNRRDFIKTTAAAGAAIGTGLSSAPLLAKEGKKATSETLVTQLYGTLNEKQKKQCVFDFDNPLRMEIENNWFITKAR